MAGQSDAVRNGIYNIATLVPMILYLAVGICLIVIYPLSKKKVAENTEVLKVRRGE
jgi:GPH family glycoside/pentoside/hexuronide:cation symporter